MVLHMDILQMTFLYDVNQCKSNVHFVKREKNNVDMSLKTTKHVINFIMKKFVNFIIVKPWSMYIGMYSI